MPFQLQQQQGKGVLDIAAFASIYGQEKWKQQKLQELNTPIIEPNSVLHMRRSPSPPTSASTLSSSFNGGGGAGNSTDNTTTTTAGGIASETPVPSASERKDEWATELQPIPAGLEVVTGSIGDRCVVGGAGPGLGLEDWETVLSESTASPGQEQSLLRWIAGDVDDASFGLRQLLQSGNNNNPLDFDGNAGGGLGIVDQGHGIESLTGGIAGGVSSSGNLVTAISPSLAAFPGSAFATNNNGNGKIGSGSIIMPSSSAPGAISYRVSSVGFNTANTTTNTATNCNIPNSNFSLPANNVALPPGMIYQHQQQSQHFETHEEKPHILNPQVLMMTQQQSPEHPQNPSFFLPLPLTQQEQHLLQPQPKRHNPGGGLDPTQIPKLPFSDPGHDFLLRKQHQQQQHLGFPQAVQFLQQQQQVQQKPPLMVAKQQQKVMGLGEEMVTAQHHQQQQQQHALLDQLYKAAELVGAGNYSHAQGILARLNQQLSPVGKPLHRAAFYFKEALQLLLLMNNPVTTPHPRSPTPFDVIFKMGAYKVFSEVSPLIQFVNFTCNQALLEALGDADRIHIIDFDIGFGAQWASFMQELPVRSRGVTTPSLKITAFASPSTHHPVELGLMRENLTQFANEIGVTLELEVVNFDSLDQTSYSQPIFQSTENEAVAVNFPIWCSSNQPAALPSLLRFVKQLSPKIVVSLDRVCDRSDLPFPQHILNALQSYINLLESLDAVNVASDTVNKIERFLLQPRIESTVLGRLRAPDKMPLWRTLFASAGFSPVTFSNFTETQAECIVKRTPVRGFHVEKRQASLVLCWQRRELISASAWRC